MIDRILKLSEFEVVIVYLHKQPARVWSSDGNVMGLVDQLLCPPNGAGVGTLSAYKKLEASANEDTQVIELDSE